MATALTLPSGFRRVGYSSVGSTNAIALARARQGEPGRLWVTADSQWQGRGRRGRSWHSPRGNLYASLLLVEPRPGEMAATLAFAAGVALHQALRDVLPEAASRSLRLKWPNDVLADGAKLSGILLEGETLTDGGFATIVGFGVNCASHPTADTAYPTTDLAAIGADVTPEALFHRLAGRMADCLARWDGGRGFAEIRADWLALAGGIGEPIRVVLGDRIVDGRFQDLDATGRLVLGRPDGAATTISAGDVFFAPAG